MKLFECITRVYCYANTISDLCNTFARQCNSMYLQCESGSFVKEIQADS